MGLLLFVQQGTQAQANQARVVNVYGTTIGIFKTNLDLRSPKKQVTSEAMYCVLFQMCGMPTPVTKGYNPTKDPATITRQTVTRGVVMGRHENV